MHAFMKERFALFSGRIRSFFGKRKRVLVLFIILAAAIAYFMITYFAGIGIPCIFRTVTGFCCPGCGVTHFAHDLVLMRFSKLPGDNAALTVLLPLWAVVAVAVMFRKNDSSSWQRLPYVRFVSHFSIIVLLAFGIIRNIPFFAFLNS